MIVSHKCRFILFSDPLGAGANVMHALSPWSDEIIAAGPDNKQDRMFFHGMTLTEAEWAFDASGLAFRSYLRISVTEQPFTRLARLYDRIAQTDIVWQLRHLASVGTPAFDHWLSSTQPNGFGAGNRHSPRWRQLGAWSTKAWESGRIDHTIRVESVEEDLTPILTELGIAPSLDFIQTETLDREGWMKRYSPESTNLMSQRYGWDLAQFGYAAPRFRKVA